jgi:hypothetical protein
MLEKSGAESLDSMPGNSATRYRVVLRCARNIAHWWLVEHFERQRGDDRISFPGEVAMQRDLMPLAVWLGVREYGGDLAARRGGGEGCFNDAEVATTE